MTVDLQLIADWLNVVVLFIQFDGIKNDFTISIFRRIISKRSIRVQSIFPWCRSPWKELVLFFFGGKKLVKPNY